MEIECRLSEETEARMGRKQAKLAKRYFRGPVPLNWIQAAVATSNRAALVGFLLWHVVALESGNKRGLKITRARRDLFGLSRSMTYRGLDDLEAARLVQVDRRRGRSPSVTVKVSK